MTDDRYPYRHQETTPDSIWVCTHLGEYGKYYPEAVEAEGEYGGTAVEYVPKQAKPEGTEDLQKQRDTIDPRALVEELRKDVFYGEERMHKFNQHNPLHMHAADALTAALDRAEKAEAEALDYFMTWEDKADEVEARGRMAGLRYAMDIARLAYTGDADGRGIADEIAALIPIGAREDI